MYIRLLLSLVIMHTCSACSACFHESHREPPHFFHNPYNEAPYSSELDDWDPPHAVAYCRYHCPEAPLRHTNANTSYSEYPDHAVRTFKSRTHTNFRPIQHRYFHSRHLPRHFHRPRHEVHHHHYHSEQNNYQHFHQGNNFHHSGRGFC